MQRLGRAEHRKALTNPPLHSAIEYPHVGKAVLAQNVRRTGGAPVRTSDRDEKARAKRREVVEATREILDGDVDSAFYTAERAFELDRCSYVEHRRRVGLRQSLLQVARFDRSRLRRGIPGEGVRSRGPLERQQQELPEVQERSILGQTDL
jgi:hypothetical protein